MGTFCSQNLHVLWILRVETAATPHHLPQQPIVPFPLLAQLSIGG